MHARFRKQYRTGHKTTEGDSRRTCTHGLCSRRTNILEAWDSAGRHTAVFAFEGFNLLHLWGYKANLYTEAGVSLAHAASETGRPIRWEEQERDRKGSELDPSVDRKCLGKGRLPPTPSRTSCVGTRAGNGNE